jgi:hypothetical protein
MFTIPNIRQTKFLLAAFILTTATLMAGVSLVMVWVGKPPFMDASMWWAIALSLFTAYSVSDVTSTHLQQSKGVAPAEQTA